MNRQRKNCILLILSLGLRVAETLHAKSSEVYTVPEFSLVDILSFRRLDELSTVLGTTGILAITDVGGDFSTNRDIALSGFCKCGTGEDGEAAPLLSVSGSDYSDMSDGLTSRTSFATATMANIPLPIPLEEMSNACGSETYLAMEALRDHVAHVSRAFVSSLDTLLKSASRAQGEAWHSETLLKSTSGGIFESVRSIVESSNNLEHFHVYSKNEELKQDSTVLQPHTDAGLFLSFVPAFSCESNGNEPDSSFFVRVPSESGSLMRRAVFPPSGSVAIMLGVGAEHWIRASHLLPLRATKHAVVMNGGDSRAWYGTMHLVPESAILQEHPLRTFSDMKKSMVVTSTKARRFASDHESDTDISIGCGISSSMPSAHQHATINSQNPTITRRRLQHVPDASACNNATNFYCWMSCLDIPNYIDAPGYLNEGLSLYCLDPSILASSGNKVSASIQPCKGIDGIIGGAMNTACMGSWQPTAPGVPSQIVIVNSTDTVVEDKYCYGGTSMYMDGFHWYDTTCVIYLFPSWALSSSASFVAACIGTLFFGVALEGVIYGRRRLSLDMPPGLKKKISTVLVYGLQLTMGYLIMLVVMTYSAPLFVCCILGLMTGHVIFNYRDKATPGSLEGATPCCQNDLCPTTDNNTALSSTVTDNNHESMNIEVELYPPREQVKERTEQPSCCGNYVEEEDV